MHLGLIRQVNFNFNSLTRALIVALIPFSKLKKQMYKEKLLAFYQANPKKAVLYVVGLVILLSLLFGGIVFAYQVGKETKRLEAEKAVIQAQQEESVRLAAIAEKAAIKAQEEERARLAAEEAERLAVVEAEKKAAEEKRIADEKATATAKAIADAKAIANAKAKAANNSQDGYCFVFPAYIIPYLKSGSLPDSATVDGHKNVCHAFENGKKDHPSTGGSDVNKKGHLGGACYDWDETPNLTACYPVKYYGKLLNNFLKNNPPESVKEHGLKFKKP